MLNKFVRSKILTL